MTILAAAHAAHTTAPPDPDTHGQSTGTLATVWNWLADHAPGGPLTILGALVILGLAAKPTQGDAGKTDWKRADQALITIVKNLVGNARRLARIARAVVRFYAGRELRGEPRSTATFLRPGKPTTTPTKDPQAVSMASIALAPPKVSLVKKPRRQPSPWARHAATWIQTYAGRGAGALDRVVRLALWAARWTTTTWRGLRTAYRVTAPVVATIARTLGAWPCWPYAARALVRVELTALVLVWLVPAWRTAAILAAIAAAALFGAVARRLTPPKPGDDEIYGPRLWAILRGDLGLPADEPLERWLHLPQQLHAADARIVIRLPWDLRGGQDKKDQITALLNSRLPGEWVGRFTFTGEHATAVYTHKPPPKPKAPDPEPPAAVDIWDPKVQEILDVLGPDEFYLGQDENDAPVIQKMADEQAHWALSVGSGGGKSAMLQWLAVQMLMKRGTVVAIDPKMVSLTPLIGTKGVHSYINPEDPHDMRSVLMWAAEVVKARNYEKKNRIRTAFEPLYVILEECNELADLLKEDYTATKQSGDPAGDPIWRDGVAKVLRLGREVNVHIIAVFQDFKDTQFGGVSLVPLFPFKIMGSYSERQWKRIIGTNIPMPPVQKKAGRMVLVLDTGDVTRIQVPYAPFDPEKTKDENQQAAYKRLRAYYEELRNTHGYSTEGLYTAPPKPSPEAAPALLRAVSRDTAAEGPNAGPEGGLSHETAGGGVTPQGAVTGDVTAARDRLYLIPGQAGADGSEGSLDAPAPLTIAEIAREMQARGYDIEASLIRQHKKRRESTGFPAGIVMGDGTEKFFLAQLIAFYEKRGIEKRESQEEAQRDDAV
ncbi:hypothetical protein CFC35_41910 [Streptomyces sp. FBKL.4005]|uniref:hypothetical protein n=1 Tax=Streptomyces sp. FBKL.4005 TaxID=2015515 RepID=UPI000B966D81|nr:hypothetical protein [Streptomyces sp. FBKL.4005]OYP09975.1 hypothetical protein CFC35_41910 [Streptomyces sp. FBKL.4005]